MSEPDFDELRRKRDEAAEKAIAELCAKYGWNPNAVRYHMSPHDCYCDCPDGPCEHQFSGWREFAHGRGGEQFCTKCGMGAMAHSMRVRP